MSNSEAIQAFPLQWPAGWRRVPGSQRKTAQFNRYRKVLSVIDGVERVLYEMGRLGVDKNDVVISTNIQTRLDGMPRSDRGEPGDPGVAVYWRRSKKTECLALDQYDRVADNLAAIAATLESMRAIERHGGASILDRVFEGFTALPAPDSWWQVLGLKGPDATEADIKQAHRRLISEHHPDTGGDTAKAASINRARDIGLEAIR